MKASNSERLIAAEAAGEVESAMRRMVDAAA